MFKIEKTNIKIINMIYEIRGKEVMLDSDLAILYDTETKRINEAVRRNKEKFPERFSWILSDEESNIFLVANCDQKIETRGGRFKNPRVFTEQGVAMLATILKTPIATQVSIAIMDALKAVNIPTVEVHISNVDGREDFRKQSYISYVAKHSIKGHGFKGYLEAIDYLLNNK